MTRYYLFDSHATSAPGAPLLGVHQYDPVAQSVDVGDHTFICVPDYLKLSREPTTYGDLTSLKNEALREYLGYTGLLSSDGFQGSASRFLQTGLRNSSALRPDRSGYVSATSNSYVLGSTPTMCRLYLEAFRYSYPEDYNVGFSAGRVTRVVHQVTDVELAQQVSNLRGSFNGSWTNFVELGQATVGAAVPIPVISQGSSFTLRAVFTGRTVGATQILSPLYIGTWALAFE